MALLLLEKNQINEETEIKDGERSLSQFHSRKVYF
jgi:hypothetical protein